MSLIKNDLSLFKSKYIKLRKNPKLFVYDWLGKKIHDVQIAPEPKVAPKNIVSKAKVVPKISKAVNTVVTKNPVKNTVIDNMYVGFNYSELSEIGLTNFIKKNINDPINKNDNDLEIFYLWKGKIDLFVSLVEWIKFNENYDLKIYTAKGGINFSSKINDNFDRDYLTRMLKKTSNNSEFFIEFENFYESKVFKVYGYDIDADNNVLFSSNNTFFKKISISKFKENFEKFNDFNNISNQKIDVVYTWVNKDDDDWKEIWLNEFPDTILDSDRFSSNDELKYSLRSINKYASWVNRVYILSNCNPPDWLDLNVLNDKIVWVDHKEAIDEDFLPTFNSHSIETSLHKIKGLSKYFIYFNDDVFLSQPASKRDFIDQFGKTATFFEEYSMVDLSSKSENDYDYIKASKNSQKLLNETYGFYNAVTLHKHVPTVLNRDTLLKIEQEFEESILTTRRAKLRLETDINLTSFFYHHYSLCNNLNYVSSCQSLLVRPKNIGEISDLKVIPYQFLCFNDGGGTSLNVEYKNKVNRVFKTHFTYKAVWEK